LKVDPYLKGIEDYQAKCRGEIRYCPYPAKSKAKKLWLNGWQMAQTAEEMKDGAYEDGGYD